MLSLDAAMAQHAKAKSLATQAEKLAKEAREAILAQTTIPEGVKQFVLRRGEYETTITLPESAPVPAHCDNDGDLYEELMDTFGDQDVIEQLFDITFKLSPEKVLAHPERARYAATIQKHMVAEAPGKPLSPRVSSK